MTTRAFEERFEIRDHETAELIDTCNSLSIAWPYAVNAAAERGQCVDLIDKGAHPGRRQTMVVSPKGLIVEERDRPGVDTIRARWQAMTPDERREEMRRRTAPKRALINLKYYVN